MANVDVFISYTHRDNWKLSDDRHGWIDRFHEAFAARLTSLCGRPLHIWRDLKLEGVDVLTPAISAALADAALFLSVFTPSYVNSEWCAKEIDLFEAAAERTGGVRIGSKSRIVKVVKTPVDRSAAFADRADLAEVLGYEFFRQDAQGVPHEFDPRLGPQSYQDFLAKINELAYGVSRLLAAAGAPSPSADVVPPSGQVVYLASTSYDLASQADQLRRELEQFGHTVLPAAPLPLLPDYAERVRDELARCTLSVHSLGSGYGPIPEGEEHSVVELQYRLAGEEAARRAAFRRVVWLAPGEEPTDARATVLLAGARDDPQTLAVSLADLKTAVLQALRPPSSPSPARTVPAARNGGAKVYAIYDRADVEPARRIEDALFDGGFEVSGPLFDGDERELREDHVDNLVACDAVLIYAGNVNDFWLRAKVRELQKAFGYGRTQPFDARAVLLADPRSPEKERFRSRDLIAVDAYGDFAPAMLEAFFLQLQRSRGEAM